MVSSLAHKSQFLQPEWFHSALVSTSVNSSNLDHVGDKVVEDGINKSSLYRQLVGYSSQLTRLASKLLVSMELYTTKKLKSQSDTVYRGRITGPYLPTEVTIWGYYPSRG